MRDEQHFRNRLARYLVTRHVVQLFYQTESTDEIATLVLPLTVHRVPDRNFVMMSIMRTLDVSRVSKGVVIDVYPWRNSFQVQPNSFQMRITRLIISCRLRVVKKLQRTHLPNACVGATMIVRATITHKKYEQKGASHGRWCTSLHRRTRAKRSGRECARASACM